MKYVVANFKMNGSTTFFKSYFKDLKKHIAKPEKMWFALPNCYLHLSDSLSKFTIGAQNISHKNSGAYTGEISAKMVTDLGAKFCLIGHSECRKRGETDGQIAQKLALAQQNNLVSILCVGESLEDKPKFRQIIKRQLAVLNDLTIDNIIIAYEPVWAIGTGKTATIKDIERVHKFIKQYILQQFDKNIAVIYGGSVNENNSREILQMQVADGVLVGGASLDASGFAKIYNSQFSKE